MKNIMHLLFLSCIKATGLIEKSFHFDLSRKEKMQLKMHTMMCDACKRYEKQSVFLEKSIAVNLHKDLLPYNIEQIKRSILENLEKANI
jgi:hypothetical protein